MKDDEKYFICGECSHTVANAKVLRAEHPFQPAVQITGCPECREIAEMRPQCDVIGCCSLAAMRLTCNDKVRHVCSRHYADFLDTEGRN